MEGVESWFNYLAGKRPDACRVMLMMTAPQISRILLCPEESRVDSPARSLRRESAGEILRAWRTARGLSQMRLAHLAGISPRHMSFVETGRSRPSRDLLLRVAGVLEIPLRVRNTLLESAGFARIYPDSAFHEPALQRVRATLQFILDRHEPYGAVVVDAGWNLLMANEPHRRMSAFFLGSDPATDSAARPNLLERVFSPDGFRPWIVNWEEVGGLLGARLRRQLEFSPPTGGLEQLLARLEEHGIPPVPLPSAEGDPPLLIPLHLRKADLDLRFFTTITTFGTPQDALVQDLRIETFFPADEATDRILHERHLGGPAAAGGGRNGSAPGSRK
jgi:transcriptional regulator with XRE-family HTH domain